MGDEADTGLNLDDAEIIREAVLGETRDPISLRRIEEFALACEHMARQAHRRIEIFSHNLDPAIYNRADFVEALSRLARANPHTEVRILLFESGTAVHNGHQLLHLAQRLTSSVHIRKVNQHYVGREESYMLADDAGIVYRAHPDAYDGFAEFNTPARVREKKHEFNEIWERSKGDPELTRHGL